MYWASVQSVALPVSAHLLFDVITEQINDDDDDE